MSTTNGFNQFLVPAEDGFLYQLIYNTVSAGNTGCTININGTEVQMGANSSIDILVRTLSGGTGCVLGGDRPYIYGDSPQYKYVPQTFVSVWDTTRISTGSSTATQVKLPLVSTGTYNFIVDWGDGSTDRITSWNQAQTTHTYATAGGYRVIITGTIYGFTFYNGTTGVGDRLKLLSIEKWGTAFRLGNNGGYFWGCENLQLDQVEDVLDLTNTTTLGSLFRDCYNITTINRINEWDTSKILDMGGIFSNCRKFNQDISNWDTSSATTMTLMFANAIKFNQNIGSWNTSNVTVMSFMFNCSTTIVGDGIFNNGGSSDIGNWDTSKVTTMTQMFTGQPLFNQPIGRWNTGLVQNMNYMFYSYPVSSLRSNGTFNQYIGDWNTSKVTTMEGIFYNQRLFNQDLSTKAVTISGVTYTAWDTSNITNMTDAFSIHSSVENGGNFNGNISNWNTSKVTTLNSILYNQKKFNQDISTKVVTVNGVSYVAWDTSNVTNMSYLLGVNNISPLGIFNQPISNWNTSKVTTMLQMFQNQPYFNQDISTKSVTVSGVTYSAWSVSAVTNMNQMFFISGNTPSGSFNNSGSTSINNWDVRKVTTMADMFNYQTGFNQPINNWIVSGVTSFSNTGLTAGFMFGKTDTDYSAENYDNLLIDWASRTVKPNQVLNMGTIRRTEASTAAKTILTSAPNNWTIVDGGLVLPFTSIWRTTANNETVTLPYLASGAKYSGIIDWGDGFISGNTYANRTHTYATAGDYTISINGMISGFCFNNTGDVLKLREITRWSSTFRPNNSVGTFYGCTNLVLTGVSDTLNLAGMTSLSSFFNSCGSLTTINRINEWNTSSITGMTSTFQHAFNFNDDIGLWDTSNVTNMSGLFQCFPSNGIFNKYIGDWDTSKVTTMDRMFNQQIDFDQDISTKIVTKNGVTYTAWSTANVLDMSFMFSGINAIGGLGKFNGNITNWDTSKVTSMSRMFLQKNKFNQDISTKVVTVGSNTYTAWDVKNVTDMGLMFYVSIAGVTAYGEFNQNIGNWNTSKVTSLFVTFGNQPSFNQDLSTKVVTVNGVSYVAWDTSNVTNMSYILFLTTGQPKASFNGNISNWNTSKVTTMQQAFQLQPDFNQDISTKVVSVSGVSYVAWDTSNVTNMSFMLIGSFPNSIGSFNQNIGNWNTSKVTVMNSMFNRQPNFNQDISTKVVSVSGVSYVAWDTSNVTNMTSMFYISGDTIGNFNQPISNWNTSKVTTMDSMFRNQPYFNQNIGTKAVTVSGVTYSAWTVSAVTTMSEMLATTGNTLGGSFNNSGSTSINNWDVRKVTNMLNTFNNQTGFNQPINNWVISGVTNFGATGLTAGFMFGKTDADYSAENYDNLLIDWSSRTVQPNLVLNMGTIKRTEASTAAKTILTSAPNNWTIVDGGLA